MTTSSFSIFHLNLFTGNPGGPDFRTANFDLNLGKGVRRRTLNHATVFQGKSTVMAWAVKELTLVLDFVLHGARKVSAPPFEGNKFAALLPDENAQITWSRVAESQGGTGLQIFSRAYLCGIKLDFFPRNLGVSRQCRRANRYTTTGYREKLEELTAGHKVVVFPLNRKIFFQLVIHVGLALHLSHGGQKVRSANDRIGFNRELFCSLGHHQVNLGSDLLVAKCKLVDRGS